MRKSYCVYGKKHIYNVTTLFANGVIRYKNKCIYCKSEFFHGDQIFNPDKRKNKWVIHSNKNRKLLNAYYKEDGVQDI